MLRSGYYRRLELGIAAAFGLHLLVFLVAPPYVPRPFRLRPEPPLRLVQPGLATGMSSAPAARSAARAAPEPRQAAVRSEQLEPTSSKRAGASVAAPGVSTGPGTGGSAGWAGGGEEEIPPVFYAYDTPPRATRRVEPDYPLAARIVGAEGTVVINANIDETGRILRAWVAQSTAPESLVEAALDAIYQFQFLPGKQGPIPVKCTVAIPFRFSLKKT
jgi:protein TonB